MILLMTKTIDKTIIKKKKKKKKIIKEKKRKKCHKFHERNQRKYE